MRTWIRFLILTTFLLTACSPASTPAAAPTPNPPTTAAAASTETPAAQITAPPPTPQPSRTPTPTRAFTSTPTPHPMEILAMRQGSYPGSDIVLERELERGANYRRFYASYLSEGLKIYALLTLPDGEMPAGGWPAIVFNHGYIPPDVYRTTERYIAYVDRLARAGYIVFRIDYRGNDQSQGRASGAYGDPGYTIDVLNAVASIKRFPQANSQAIGMWGHSMGGFLTLRAMVLSTDIKAGVIWSGVVASYNDILYNWRRPAPAPTPPSDARRWRSQWLEKYGTPADNPAFWNSISANSYLGDLSGPIQLHHGTADVEVPLAFTESLAAQLQAAGKEYEFYQYEGSDHNLTQGFTLAMDRTIEFFDRYLKTGE